MKLFVVAALIAVSSAARLEHLERSYLPPDSSNSLSGGFGSQPNGFGASNGFGSHGSNGLHGSHGFGSNLGALGSQYGNNFGANSGSDSDSLVSGSLSGFGSNGQDSNAVNGLKQYLPPDAPSSGSNGFGSSIKPACTSCGFARQPSFGSQPSTQYGQPQYQPQYNQFGSRSQFPGSSFSQPQFGAAPTPSFGTNGGSFGSFARDQGVNRQYLAPKTQEIPQQPFDEQTGYQY